MSLNSFRTSWKIPHSVFTINHASKVLMIGSCFSENIHKKLVLHKFNSAVNPYGILFNPNSIFQNINKVLQTDQTEENELIQHDQLWHSFDHHSSFSDPDKSICLKHISDSKEKLKSAITESKFLILTFGTAFIYKHIESNRFVANCHKIPQSEFQKKLLSISEITKEFDKTFRQVKEVNPSIKIILTLSPVRHWKDGVVENQKSKAILHLAISEICDRNENAEYFPSYEIVMDDLRDYRFYNPDLLHPNQMAIDYIWEKFSQTYFNQETLELNTKIEQIQKSVHHRPLHPKSIKNQKFLLDLKSKIQVMQMQYPQLSFDSEMKIVDQNFNSNHKS